MDRRAAKALAIIRECVRLDRVVLLPHFSQRLDGRNYLWLDVLAVLESPRDVRDGGHEEFGRPKWIMAGDGVDGLPLEFVCILDADDRGRITVFVTIYWV